MSALYHQVTDWMAHQQAKHDLGDSYVEKTVNGMTQHEFLEAISEALDVVIRKAIEEANAQLAAENLQLRGALAQADAACGELAVLVNALNPAVGAA